MKFKNYTLTKVACYIGYVTQAICINFAPLLYVSFNRVYGISLTKISLLIGFNFGIQILTDAIFSKIADRFPQRLGVILGQTFAVLGLVGYTVLPEILPSAFLGLAISSSLCGIGGGLTEVLISPIIEALPTKQKEAQMAILHSFYCWGQASVILLSTLYFAFFSVEKWKVLSLLWAIPPFLGLVLFLFVPLLKFGQDEEKSGALKFFKNKIFIVFLILMVCSGASEMIFSQWASTFAETALGISKSVGDIVGPCLFAVLMGTSRVVYALLSKKIDTVKIMMISMIFCTLTYLSASLSSLPMISLLSMTFCGLTVGIMWPGLLSLSAKKVVDANTSMFSILALAGDIGCLGGGFLAGAIADVASNGLRTAFLVSALYPLIASALLLFLKKKEN